MKLPLIISAVSQNEQINEILKLNETTLAYGLSLSNHEIMQIIEVRNQVLKGYGRIEIGTEVMNKLIKNFYTSPFIEQDKYLLTLMELQEVFYYMKNETEDSISDDELIDILVDFYENYCRGSMELLQGREIENFARKQRIKNQQIDFFSGRNEF